MSSFLINPYRFGIYDYDTDAQAYITAVETADGQALETAVQVAIHSFVKGCKADGIWNAIKASCILAGARTLSGALVPLVGTAPTNNNFVSGDYNRKTGLVGNGSTKYLNSNRNNNSDPQNSNHLAVYATTAATSSGIGTSSLYPMYLGAGRAEYGSTQIGRNINGNLFFRNRARDAVTDVAPGTSTGLIAINRNVSSSSNFRMGGSTGTVAMTSLPPYNGNVYVYVDNHPGFSDTYCNARLTFYSIGESLDLALLDARVSALISAYSVAIP